MQTAPPPAGPACRLTFCLAALHRARLLSQVLLRRFILSRGYETSYTCLARRAAKTNNIWNRLVRRGSALRRCAVYGGLQGVFTATTLCVAVPTYFCYPLAVLLQASDACTRARVHDRACARVWWCTA